MKIERMSQLAAVWMLIAALASGAAAQGNDGEEVEEMRVISIEHGLAPEVLSIVRSIAGNWLAVNMTADPRANRIIAYGGKNHLDRLATIVAELDVPVAKPEGSSRSDSIRTEILTVNHRPAGEFHDIVQMHLSDYGHLVVDAARNALVIRERPATIDKVRSLVHELDVESDGLVLHFFVLASGGEKLDSIPDAARVKVELERLGLRDYGIAGRAAVRCLETSPFETKSSFRSGEIFIGGRARLVSGRRAVEVQLNSDIRLLTQEEGKPAVQRSTAKLSSTLKAPLDHLVLVGLTPSGEASSRPLVMVMRVARE